MWCGRFDRVCDAIEDSPAGALGSPPLVASQPTAAVITSSLPGRKEVLTFARKTRRIIQSIDHRLHDTLAMPATAHCVIDMIALHCVPLRVTCSAVSIMSMYFVLRALALSGYNLHPSRVINHHHRIYVHYS